MVSFIAVYRGESVATAKLVAVSADPELVAHVASALLAEQDASGEPDEDPALRALRAGRRHAVQLVRDEANLRGGGNRDEGSEKPNGRGRP